ncbi:MAG: hypothetical protein LBH97_04715 [Treponema sp.]|jgi:hypothetical protein|nr:hypothetical protein [Treponema sp.]
MAILPLFPQEIDSAIPDEVFELLPDSQPNAVFTPDSGAVYVISSIDFNIRGRTRPDALMRKGEFREGEKIQGTANLEKYISEKTQLLINQRVLKDNVVIDYSIGEQQENGDYPVTLLIRTEDTWNIIAVPYPKYSSNTGFELIIKARDYNFLGAMNPLRLDIGYKYDQNQHNFFVLELTSDYPFKAFGYNWNFVFNNAFNYRPDVEEPFYYNNQTGLFMELPFKRTTFTFGFREYFYVNAENSDSYKLMYPAEQFQKGLFMSSILSTSWEIPTGLAVAEYGELTWTPEISATFPHEFPPWPLADYRRGPFMTLSHSLGFKKIDWFGNYRKGFDVSMNNAYNYNFFRLENDKDALSVTFSLGGIGHFIISDFFGISANLRYRQWYYHDPDYYDNAGDALRGILDKAVYADYMLSLNLDFPFRVLQFMPSQWFGNPKLSFFDFEMHLSPIIDMALYHNPDFENNFLMTGGLEVIVFPGFMRSLYLRISLGFNLAEYVKSPSKLPDGDNREIFVGIGHHY